MNSHPLLNKLVAFLCIEPNTLPSSLSADTSVHWMLDAMASAIILLLRPSVHRLFLCYKCASRCFNVVVLSHVKLAGLRAKFVTVIIKLPRFCHSSALFIMPALIVALLPVSRNN